MASHWGIAEWYGQDIRHMSSNERAEAAEIARRTDEGTLGVDDRPECPFLSNIIPGSRCNKAGGVCSIRRYETDGPVRVDPGAQPACTCPNRFLEEDHDETVFAYLARTLFGVSSGSVVIKEIPFLEKVSANGSARSAKAGRIDWVLVPTPPTKGDRSAQIDWLAIETQAVYFSGAKMGGDFATYEADPAHLHVPTGQRRPDYRSSGAKRLAPQLDVKSPVMRRWGKKVAVVIDRSFFEELGVLPDTVEDFDNAEVVWVVMGFNETMNLMVEQVTFAELDHSVQALQATRPVNKSQFESGLKSELWKANSKKVYDS